MAVSHSSPEKQNALQARVIVVDDMPQVLHDLRQLLELTSRVEVVAEAGNGQEAVRLAGELLPDAILMDLEMPGMDGYEATRQIKQRPSAPRVIILSVHAGPNERERARAAGADGFVMKGADYEDLVNALLEEMHPPIPMLMRKDKAFHKEDVYDHETIQGFHTEERWFA